MKTVPPSSPTPTPAGGKSLPTVLTIVQLIAMCAVVAWVVSLKSDLKQAEAEVALLRETPVPDPRVVRENQTLRAQLAELEVEVATLSVNAAAAQNAAATAAATAASTGMGAGNPIAALVNNPAMRTMMATRQRQTLESRYTELFNRFQFTPEQRAQFVDILLEQQTSRTDAGLKMVGGSLGPAEQAALRQEMAAQTAAADQKLRALLGDEAKYSAYRQFNELQPERNQVSTLRASLARAGQPPLAPDQASLLAQMMYTERKAFPFTRAAGEDPTNPMPVPAAEMLAARAREQEQLNNRIAERAAAVLTPEQLATFRAEQARQLETQKASAEMARQLLGGTRSR